MQHISNRKTQGRLDMTRNHCSLHCVQEINSTGQVGKRPKRKKKKKKAKQVNEDLPPALSDEVHATDAVLYVHVCTLSSQPPSIAAQCIWFHNTN